MDKCKKCEADTQLRADYDHENEIEKLSSEKRKLPVEESYLPTNKIPADSDFYLTSGSVTAASYPKHQLSMREFTVKTSDRQKRILDRKIS